MILIEWNWEDTLSDQPIERIMSRLKRRRVDFETAADGMKLVDEIAGNIAKQKIADIDAQLAWKVQYFSKLVLNALYAQKGGYKKIIDLSENCTGLAAALDQIERDYGGSRITMKRITDPNHAEAAEKLLKARVARRKQLAQKN
jgi:hypothetical protein